MVQVVPNPVVRPGYEVTMRGSVNSAPCHPFWLDGKGVKAMKTLEWNHTESTYFHFKWK